jgi:hypothetical protein
VNGATFLLTLLVGYGLGYLTTRPGSDLPTDLDDAHDVLDTTD